MRLLFWLLLIGLLVAWLMRKPSRKSRAAPKASADSTAEPMLQCRHCGLHFPGSEAVRGEGDAAYCSEAHLRLGPKS